MEKPPSGGFFVLCPRFEAWTVSPCGITGYHQFFAARRSGMIKVGIVGGTGYTGVELLRLLARHPEVELTAITSRGDAGQGGRRHVSQPARFRRSELQRPKDAPTGQLRRGVLRHAQRHRHAAGRQACSKLA
jgi:hypothetical protein